MSGGYALELSRPLALLALALLLPVGYYFVRSLVDFGTWQRAVSLAVRTAILVLLALALAGLTLMKPTTEQYVIFAVDRSLSVGDDQRRAADDFIAQAMRHAGGDKAAVLEFAA